MTVKVRVRKELDKIPRRVKAMRERGQFALAQQAHADMNNYVPFLSGDLRNQSYITDNGRGWDQIVWYAPYARRQYYNYGAKFTTPGTGPNWDGKARSIHMKSWQRVAKAAMK